MKNLFTIVIAVVSFGSTFSAKSQCTNLFISEYVEGLGNNKAIELYNPTSNPINLSNYQLARYSNGSTSPSIIGLMGIIQPHDVKVLVVDKRDPNGTGFEEPIDAALEAIADTFLTPFFNFPTSAMYFNGNDAVALLTSTNVIIDVLGRIGEDPGDQWGWQDQNGAQWTKDHTLIRKANIEDGDNNGFDVFWPETQWDSLSVNTYSNLGFHDCNCNVPPPCTTTTTVNYAGLNSSYLQSDGPATLAGSPSGGVFFGAGMSGNQFNPATAGLGTHSIVYTYVDGSGCIGSYALCTTVDLTIGSPNGDLESIGVDVYPNPSNGTFMVNVPQSIVGSSYSVYSLKGDLVFGGVLSTSNNVIEILDFGSGAYTLVVNSSEGLYTQNLVVE